MPESKKDILDAIIHHEQSLKALYAKLNKDQQSKAVDVEHLAEGNNIATWQFQFENKDLYWSPRLYEIFEIKNQNDIQLFDFYISCFDEEDLKELEHCIAQIENGDDKFYFHHKIHLPTGNVKQLECSGFPLKDNAENIIGIKGIVRELNQSNHLLNNGLSQFFEASVDLQCIANEKGFFVEISPSWVKLMGYSKEELCSRPFLDFVHPDDYQRTIDETTRMIEQGMKSLSFENRYVTKNGEVVDLSWNSTIDDVTKLIYCTARNITEEKAENRKLKINLSEKELLLREIHHRVKNNLQIISSLLSLQANMEAKNAPRLRKLYLDSQVRINSMAAIHELFYRSDSLKMIEFKKYIKKLVCDVLHAFEGDKKNLSTKLDINDFYLNLDTAIPLGLLANEIISNSIKHAFKEEKRPTLYVKTTECSTKECILLEIGDNGCGFDRKKLQTETLGVTIIDSLVSQLDGNMEITSSKNKGTHYKIEIKRQ